MWAQNEGRVVVREGEKYWLQEEWEVVAYLPLVVIFAYLILDNVCMRREKCVCACVCALSIFFFLGGTISNVHCNTESVWALQPRFRKTRDF